MDSEFARKVRCLKEGDSHVRSSGTLLLLRKEFLGSGGSSDQQSEGPQGCAEEMVEGNHHRQSTHEQEEVPGYIGNAATGCSGYFQAMGGSMLLIRGIRTAMYQGMEEGRK